MGARFSIDTEAVAAAASGIDTLQGQLDALNPATIVKNGLEAGMPGSTSLEALGSYIGAIIAVIVAADSSLDDLNRALSRAVANHGQADAESILKSVI